MIEDIKNKLFENKNKNKLVKRKKDNDDGNEFKRSQYMIMHNRCLHELKMSAADQVAAKMEMTE